MKINNETKVGILTIVSIVLLILGYNFLRGNDLFHKQKKLYAVFADLGSLQKANDVKINGLPVGTVYDYKEIDKNLSGIIVEINMKRDVNIPVNSVANIASEFIGSSYIDIKLGDADRYLKNGDTLQTEPFSSLFSDVRAQINPTLGKLREAIDSLKVVLGDISQLFEKENKGNIQDIILNLKETTESLNVMLNSESGPLAKTLNNASSFSENLKKNNDSITQLISNTKKLTGRLAELNLQKTIDSIEATLTILKSTAARITSNDGTLGKLINDPELYKRLNETILAAEILMDDIRVHPKRYTGHIIFNRKDKTGPLTSPSKKDTLPARDN